MSLLLEALKKAELAKQNAARQDERGPVTQPGSPIVHLEPLTGNSVEPPNITRDRLPDITQPLEILSEDLPSAAARRNATPPTPPTPLPEPAVTPARPAQMLEIGDRESRTIPTLTIEDRERASARQLFEAKSVEYNPRRPFYIAVGVLAVVGVAVVGYFVYQIAAPRPSFYTGPGDAKATQRIAAAPAAPINTPQRSEPPPSTAPTIAAAAPPTASDAIAANQSIAQTSPSIPAPPQPAPATGAATTSKSSAPRSASPPAPTASDAAAGSGTPRTASPARTAVTVKPATQRLDPRLERAWEALQAGNLSGARDEYLRVLQSNPMDRDALLGLATIDARNRDFDGAEARYLRVLEIDPRDPYAQAGVIALRGQIDPVQSESRLKNLLAQQPEAPFLNFALGNQLAAQSRWAEAQAAYFKAYTADPENADYAFNLAVSLDHLRQPRLALDYYQRALGLSAQRAAGFDRAQIETRVRELQR